jgi:hypothetical protein
MGKPQVCRSIEPRSRVREDPTVVELIEGSDVRVTIHEQI